MNRRERIMAAVERRAIDRFPADIWCVQEIKNSLQDYCGVIEWVDVLDALDIDGIIGLKPPYIGPAIPDLGEAMRTDEWGFVYRRQEHATGVYWEEVAPPLAHAESVVDIDAYRWPSPDWYDYAALPDMCAAYSGRAVQIGYTAIFYWHNRLRGLERSLVDIAIRPEFSRHLIRRVADFFLEYHSRCFESAGAGMQLAQVTDDFGSQTGLIISKGMIADYFEGYTRRAIDLAHAHGIKVFHHDDGAILSLIPDLIDMGIDVLNPVQWRCRDMDRGVIGRRFAGRVCFHGAVDNQHTLPFGTPADVCDEVATNLRTLGHIGTGYIIAPCHNIQANTPLENILALYASPRHVAPSHQTTP